MRKAKYKNVKDFYELEPKITELSNRNCRPTDEIDRADCICLLNMGSFNNERGHGERRSLSGKSDMKENMCATPFSCRLNPKQVASPMGTNRSNGCKGKHASRGCFNDNVLLSPSLGSTCNRRYQTGSEISNLLGGCSSDDSYCENAESKANLRASATSEDTRQILTENHGFAKASIFHGGQISLNQHGKQKESECLSDDISCISGADYMNVIACNHNSDTDRKNALCGLASVHSLPLTEIAVNDQLVSCHTPSSRFHEVDKSQPRGLDKFPKESSQGEPSNCSEEQVESSLIRVTSFRVGNQINDVRRYPESLKPDSEISDGIPAFEVVKSSIQNEYPEKASEPPAVVDVKVCDICGDAGKEYLLANCSKCGDGAEHTYCMRVKLEKIPEGDWICEECMRTEETKRDVQDHSEKGVTTVSSQISLNEAKKNSQNSSAFNHKNHMRLGIKGSGFETSKMGKLRSDPCFSSKRPAQSLKAIPVTERRVSESTKQYDFSRPSSKLCRNSSIKNLDNVKMKQSCEVTSSVPGIGDRTPKLQPENTMSQGSLSKSKSNKIMDSKVKVQLSEDSKVKVQLSDAGLLKRNFSKETKCVSKLYNPLVSSPVADSSISASMTDEKIAPAGETILPLSSGSIYHDLKDVQGHVKSNHLSNSASFFANGDIIDGKQNRVSNDVRWPIMHPTDVTVTIKGNNSSTTVPFSERSSLRDFPWFASAIAIPSGFSVVPELNYIWKGQFEIQRGGRLPSYCTGIQAHLSNRASCKVLEAVRKIPRKIILKEVPRLNIWPTQFLENHATEDDLGLYFFAYDVESYERRYKNLLDCMIKNDLCLRGDVDGVELLIFPSNLLPDKSQRWNKLFFLWGVFRGRIVNCSSELPILQKKHCIFSKNGDRPSQYLSDFPMFGSRNLSCYSRSNENSSTSMAPYDVQQTSEALSTEQKVVNLQTISDCQQSRVYNVKSEQLCKDVPHNDSSEIEDRDSKMEEIVDHSFRAGGECNTSSLRVDEEQMCKRLKSSNNSKDPMYLGETFSTGLGPSFSAKDHLDGGDDRMGFMSVERRILTKNGSDYLGYEVPNLDLSLGIEDRRAQQIAMPLFRTADSENIQSKHSEPATGDKREDDDAEFPVPLSLSLSLALPLSGKESSVNTSLSL